MKGTRFSRLKMRLYNTNGILRNPIGAPWSKRYHNAGLVLLAGFAVLVIMFRRESITESSTNLIDDIMSAMNPTVEPYWNYGSYHFEPNVSDWDEQRAEWPEENPNQRPQQDRKSRVLMVTESAPYPSQPSISSHVLLKAAKNKLDYCRIHDIELFYNMGYPDAEFTDSWTKLPVIRMLMLQHPEVEWLWWLNADAVLTDMSFVPPFDSLDEYNLVLHGDDRLVYSRRERTGANVADFFIRNCQWSLDLLDAWASMGAESFREESGKFQSSALFNRSSDLRGDDQSGIVVLLAQDKKSQVNRWAPKVKLVKDTEFSLTGDWQVVAPNLESFSEKPPTDMQDQQSVPLVTQFAGCLPGIAEQNVSIQPWEVCQDQLERTFDFADNQVYDQYGYLPRELGNPQVPLVEKEDWESKGKSSTNESEYFIPPKINDWDEQRRAWMAEHPRRPNEEVVLVSGSAPKPCENGLGSHLLLRGFKNKIDYCRLNDIPFFYNMAVIHKNLTGWWSKLPVLRMMMLNNPSVEWIWWMDSDAVLTSMYSKYPFERYNESGYNMVMYGEEHEVYERKWYAGINTGNFLIRNCQWSLDLFDRWASFGATHEIRVKYGVILNNFLDRPYPGWSADDQSALVYLLVKEREKWGRQVLFENHFAMSGEWNYWTIRMDGMAPKDRPFCTHFAGCKPCALSAPEVCLEGMDKSYNFADNQLLEKYGLRHVALNSLDLLRVPLYEGENQAGDEMAQSNTETDTSDQKDEGSSKEGKSGSAEEDPATSKDSPTKDEDERADKEKEGQKSGTGKNDESDQRADNDGN